MVEQVASEIVRRHTDCTVVGTCTALQEYDASLNRSVMHQTPLIGLRGRLGVFKESNLEFEDFN